MKRESHLIKVDEQEDILMMETINVDHVTAKAANSITTLLFHWLWPGAVMSSVVFFAQALKSLDIITLSLLYYHFIFTVELTPLLTLKTGHRRGKWSVTHRKP